MGIDPGTASAFLCALTRSENPVLQWQTFADNTTLDKASKRALASTFYASFRDAFSRLEALNANGAGVFYTVNATDGRGRGNENVIGLRAVFVDKDNGPLDEALITLPPSIRIESSAGKEHALWLLRPGEDPNAFEQIQRSLARHFGGDELVDLARVLRLPGSVHAKVDPKKGLTGVPFQVALKGYGWRNDYTLAEIAAAYPMRAKASKKSERARERDVTAQTAGRNVTLTSFAGTLRASGAEHAQILGALLAENQKFPDPLDASEVEQIAQSVSRYEKRNDPAFNDAIAKALPAIMPVAAAPQERPWTSLLLTDAKGIPKSCVANGITILENHSAWTGVLGHNDRYAEIWFLKRPPCDEHTKYGPYPRALNDGDIGRIHQWFAYSSAMGDFGVDRALVAAAQIRHFDPVVDYLDAGTWDRTPRLPTLLQRYCGAVGDPRYLALVGIKWMIQCVARAMSPGCQGDMTLILEGTQAVGKTSFFRIMGGRWFGERPPKDFGQKMSEFIRGPWIVEFGELSQFTRAEIEDIKSFLTLLTDRYRPAYGRTTGEFPRRCSFGGSTNRKHYLVDTTGNRRYAPIACKRFDLDALICDRDQLWAEAVTLYDLGAKWHVLPGEAPLFAVEQEARVVDDAIIFDIRNALEKGVRRDFSGLNLGGPPGEQWSIPPNATNIGVSEIARAVFSSRDLDMRLQMRITNALRILGWELDRGSKRWIRAV